MKINEGCVWRIGEIMIQKGWINWGQLNQALAIQQQSGQRTGEILVESGMVSRKNLFRALATQYGMAFVDLQSVIPQPEALTSVPKRLAYQYHVVPLVVKAHVLLIACDDPLNAFLEKELKTFSDLWDVRCVLSPPQDIDEALSRYYGPEGVLAA